MIEKPRVWTLLWLNLIFFRLPFWYLLIPQLQLHVVKLVFLGARSVFQSLKNTWKWLTQWLKVPQHLLGSIWWSFSTVPLENQFFLNTASNREKIRDPRWAQTTLTKVKVQLDHTNKHLLWLGWTEEFLGNLILPDLVSAKIYFSRSKTVKFLPLGLSLPPNVIRQPRGPEEGQGFERWAKIRFLNANFF